MKLEHEIPQGTRLYFGETAKIKRRIEAIASDVLYGADYEELITPLFSYHQHLSIADEKQLIRVNDTQNYQLTLRADSTIDVVRLLDKRLGRNTSHQKWFYIQPVYLYPSKEIYQIGAEYIGEKDLSKVLQTAIDVVKALDIKPLLQLSNIRIPELIAKELDIDLDLFKHINIQKLLDTKVSWLKDIIYLEKLEEIDAVIAVVPDIIKVELERIKELAQNIEYDNFVIAPLYYAKMLYYDELYFRMIEKNDVYARGGRYINDEVTSVGFALYTDKIIEKLEGSK
ncbi:ATP phosphoribosyltransferase regulatory subunit [Sulfurimonas sp. MAG313]|nr:ATP phosphoribosyltransferase regulatory subunit [Sulfurimonas sp. MAG313]MDF1880837.1 ATP phosphoribosyltransferase regulatory subunit [Sulfurimonas sp. MAG313]